MATVYVNVNATGAGDGSSMTDGYTSVETAFAAASADDTLEIAAGTYEITAMSVAKNITFLKTTDPLYQGFVKFQNTTLNNYMILSNTGVTNLFFKGIWLWDSFTNQPMVNVFAGTLVELEDCIVGYNATGKGINLHQSFTGKFYAKRTRFLGCAFQMFSGGVGANAFTEQYDGCIFSGGPPGQFQRQVNAGSSTREFNHCIFGGTEGTSQISVVNGAGNSTMNSCIVMPIGLDLSATQNIADATASPTITANNSILMENWAAATATYNEVADGGNNIGPTQGDDVTVNFTTPRRSTACVSLMIDDYNVMAQDGETFATMAEDRGLVVNFCVQAQHVTTAGAEKLANFINRGHGVSLHGNRGVRLYSDNHPAITITGPSPSTVTIADNTMTFTGTGQEGPITLSDDVVVGTVATTINGWTGWSTTADPGTATNSSGAASSTLADVTALDVSGGDTIDLDEDRLNTYELVDGKADLESKIRAYIPNWICGTHVWANGNVDAASELAAFNAGFIAARGSLGEQGLWSWPGSTTGYRPFRSYAVLLGPAVFTDADATRRASALMETMKWFGCNWNIYNHNLTGISPSNPPLDATKWGLIMDQVVASGIRCLTYEEQAKEMTTGATPLTAHLEYTRDFSAEDATWEPTLKSSSQCNGAGANGTDNIVGINQEPFMSVDRDIGATQNTDAGNHPFHPLNL